VEKLTGRDFNDSGEAKDGAHTTELLKEEEKEKLRLELESLDQSRKRGRGGRSGRLWLYGRPAIKKREQQAGLAWLAGCLAAWLLELPEQGLEQRRAASGCSHCSGWIKEKGWLATPVAGRAGGLGTVGTGVAPAGRRANAP
jgi:hypothetical protein